MKKLIFLFFLGFSLSWIPPGNATNVAEKGTAVQSVMAKDFFIAVQPVTAIGLTLCSVSQSNDQSLVANKNVATKENSHKRRVEFMVGVLSFKRPAKLTISLLNSTFLDRPVTTKSKHPAIQANRSNQPEYMGIAA